MKKYVTAFQMTQSMFCSLPFPCRKWEEGCRPYMLIFLPMIGLEIGVLWQLLDIVLKYLKISGTIYGLAMCLWTYLVTGFMHLDGFMDVTDAVGSWRNLEKRREILKDSHVGSFAVVWTVFLILAGFSAFSSGAEKITGSILLTVPVLSRCCSALAVMNLKAMNTSQYAENSCYPKVHSLLLVAVLLLFIVLSFLDSLKMGMICLAELTGYSIALKRSYGSLQGMNGDISGFCICISELSGIMTAVLW